MAHDQTQNLSIEASAWGPEAAEWLERAKGAASLADLHAQALAGASVFLIRHEGQTVGAFLLRIDQTDGGPEGVIVAAAASLHGVDMTATCLPAIEQKFKGCKTVRYHTGHPALARKMIRHGYMPAEIVSIKKLRA